MYDRVDKILAELTEAIRLNPNDAEAYYNRARAYVRKGDYRKAEYDHDMVRKIKVHENNIDEDIPAYIRKVNDIFVYYKDDYDSAIADLTEAIRANPDDAEAYFNRARAHSLKGDDDSAIADYGELVRLEQNPVDTENPAKVLINRNNAHWFTNAYLFRGKKNFYIKEDYDKAISDYTEAIRMLRTWHNNTSQYSLYTGMSYRMRAKAHHAKNDYDQAIADYKAALRIDPDCAGAKDGLAEAQRLKGETEKAG